MITTAAAVKATLVAAIRDLPTVDTSTVLVSYAQPVETPRRETIHLGDVEDGEQTPVALRAGRRKRQEDYTLSVVVTVASSPTPEKTDARAAALAGAVEEFLADHPKLYDEAGPGPAPVPGLIAALASGVNLTTGLSSDGAVSTLTLTVAVKAQIV